MIHDSEQWSWRGDFRRGGGTGKFSLKMWQLSMRNEKGEVIPSQKKNVPVRHWDKYNVAGT